LEDHQTEGKIVLIQIAWRTFFAFAAVLSISIICHSQPGVKINTSNPKTVLDYYLLLPLGYAGVEDEARAKHRRQEFLDSLHYGSILDIPNDYIRYKGDSGWPNICVALFRHSGRVLIAVFDYGYDGSDPGLNLLRYESGKWRDVTEAMLPPGLGPHDNYELPRYGTTIPVANRQETKRGYLKWRNGAFVFSRAR
jgi:hypothetical protein